MRLCIKLRIALGKIYWTMVSANTLASCGATIARHEFPSPTCSCSITPVLASTAEQYQSTIDVHRRESYALGVVIRKGDITHQDDHATHPLRRLPTRPGKACVCLLQQRR